MDESVMEKSIDWSVYRFDSLVVEGVLSAWKLGCGRWIEQMTFMDLDIFSKSFRKFIAS